MAADILVTGSCNMDLITYAPRLPLPGETIHGTRYVTGFGGKGSNQCVAAAKLGAKASMIAKVGNDAYGKEYIENFKALGIDTGHVTMTEDACTGVAPIVVGADGTNSIIIVPGANLHLTESDIDAASSLFQSAKVMLCQLEISPESTLCALRKAKGAGVFTIFNPAPAPQKELDPDFYKNSDIVCPNETEASTITGLEVTDVESAKVAVPHLLKMGCGIAIITLGKDGCVFASKEREEPCWVKGEKVNAVDTTGAGDAFAGALAFFFAKFPHLPLEEKLRRSCYVASDSVCREGTQKSYPYRRDLPEEIFA
uniref:Ribokinase n=1 Tax=Phallusia mammillata TaxID=59560 RepID=A0A6F9DR41_9ASCI|nr:ribokinase-like [Phallusia mammillata]